MGIGPALAALLALLGAAGVFAADRLTLLPWPHVASQSLLALFLLAAVTRVAADAGVRAQQHARYAVAGVAATAGAWFLLAGASGHRALALLGALHLTAAWLAAAWEPQRLLRARALQVAAVTGMAVSLLAHAALGTSQLAAFLAGIAIVGGALAARGRRTGVVAAGAVAVYALALGFRIGRGPEVGFSTMVALTLVVSAAPLVLALWRAVVAPTGGSGAPVQSSPPAPPTAASAPAGSRSRPAAR